MHLDQFHDDAQRLDPFDIAGQVGTDAETRSGTTTDMAENIQRLLEIQAVGKHQFLALGIDAQRLVTGDDLVCPLARITRILAQAVIEFGEVQVEGLEEEVRRNAVGQRDAQAPAVFLHPTFERHVLALIKARQLLVHHQPFVGHGADQWQVEFIGQLRVGGADEHPGEVALHHADHFPLRSERQAPAGREVRHPQLRQLLFGGVFL